MSLIRLPVGAFKLLQAKARPGGRMGLFADSAVHINLNNIDAVHFLPCIPQA